MEDVFGAQYFEKKDLSKSVGAGLTVQSDHQPRQRRGSSARLKKALSDDEGNASGADNSDCERSVRTSVTTVRRRTRRARTGRSSRGDSLTASLDVSISNHTDSESETNDITESIKAANASLRGSSGNLGEDSHRRPRARRSVRAKPPRVGVESDSVQRASPGQVSPQSRTSPRTRSRSNRTGVKKPAVPDASEVVAPRLSSPRRTISAQVRPSPRTRKPRVRPAKSFQEHGSRSNLSSQPLDAPIKSSVPKTTKLRAPSMVGAVASPPNPGSKLDKVMKKSKPKVKVPSLAGIDGSRHKDESQNSSSHQEESPRSVTELDLSQNVSESSESGAMQDMNASGVLQFDPTQVGNVFKAHQTDTDDGIAELNDPLASARQMGDEQASGPIFSLLDSDQDAPPPVEKAKLADAVGGKKKSRPSDRKTRRVKPSTGSESKSRRSKPSESSLGLLPESVGDDAVATSGRPSRSRRNVERTTTSSRDHKPRSSGKPSDKPRSRRSNESGKRKQSPRRSHSRSKTDASLSEQKSLQVSPPSHAATPMGVPDLYRSNHSVSKGNADFASDLDDSEADDSGIDISQSSTASKKRGGIGASIGRYFSRSRRNSPGTTTDDMDDSNSSAAGSSIGRFSRRGRSRADQHMLLGDDDSVESFGNQM